MAKRTERISRSRAMQAAEVQQMQEMEKTRCNFRFSPKTGKQNTLFQHCLDAPLVIATGPAGTGKSYVLAAAAVTKLLRKEVDQIILTRNPLPTGTSLGFFKGDDNEKMKIWLAPILSTLRKILKTPSGSDGFYNYLLEQKKIQMLPMETVKGSSFDRAVIIVEEAQECDLEQIKNLTTRAGEESAIFLNGDTSQSNSKLRDGAFRRFTDAIKKENEYSLTAREEWDRIIVPVATFSTQDIVRSDITRKMVTVFDKHGLVHM